MPELTPFDPETASDDYFKSRHKYTNASWQEAMPDDPALSLEYSVKNAQSWKLLEDVKLEVWHLWEDGQIVAELFLSVDFDENDLHLFALEIQVLKPYRRKGYAKSLLERAAAFAEKYGRTLATGNTSSFAPDGQGFAQRVGATNGLEESTNQLVLDTVAKNRLNDWLDLAHSQARDFELGFWGSRYPEGDIDAVAELFDVMNSAPRDDLDVRDWQTKPEQLRNGEAYEMARGIERWVLYLRHKPSRKLAGFTVTFWYPENPENLEQGATGVLPEYRGNGLGKWLKAAMIQKVLTERPAVKRIRTGNADSNAPMLAINKELGFEFYKSNIVWQLKTSTLEMYLKTR